MQIKQVDNNSKLLTNPLILGMGRSQIFSDFGEMSEQNTMTPEATDAAPDEVEPPETEILIEK